MERDAWRLERLGHLGFDFRGAETSASYWVHERPGEGDLFLDSEPHQPLLGSQRR